MNRRKLLKHLLASGAGAPLLACSTVRTTSGFQARAGFLHGVASGDPLAERAIIWTRLSGQSGRQSVSWEVASNADFSRIVRSGQLFTDASRDFTCKVDVGGLHAGTPYYYRFHAGPHTSKTGRFKTLPRGKVQQLKLGLVSCSNYSFGYFNAYRHLAEHDLDAVYHAGDYIYEYEAGGYDAANAADMGREAVPRHELITLADYRIRHAQYKSDPDLQAVHARHAFICSWDDHEVANDSFVGGAENHQRQDGDWQARKQAALQAYFEWMPVREPRVAPEQNYRAFQFGELFSLIVLETRLSGRDQALSYATDLPWIETAESDEPQPDIRRFVTEVLPDPARRMISAEQEIWLVAQLQASKRAGIPWQLIGNQTLLAQIIAPDFSGQFTPEQLAALDPRAQQFVEFSTLGLPYNLDAWDGYPAARQRVLEAFSRHANNAVVLTGDTHNAWANNVTGSQGNNVAAEIAVASITSPGASDILGLDNAQMPAMVQANNPNVAYTNTSDRGYAVLTIEPDHVLADFYFVDRIDSTNSTQRLEQSVKLAASPPGETAALELL